MLCNYPASALPAAGSLPSFRRLRLVLPLASVALLVALLFVPWQQSIRGPGKVIAYAPLDRQQTVEAPIDGRVKEWFVEEGQRVRRGEPIAEISDNDPDILDRLRREKAAAEAQVQAAVVSVAMGETRVISLQTARDSAVDNARMRLQMAKERVQAAELAVDAAEATVHTADLQLRRQTNLADKGLASQRQLELAELDQETGRAELERGRATLRAAQAEVRALSADVTQVGSANDANIDAARSALEKLRADQAGAEADLAKVEVRLARQQQMRVVAPRDGTILRLVAKQGTEMVSAGDPLVLFVPDSAAAAVELYLDGNDAPLVEAGRHVRLQFEGWPAVQFVGWPSVAVGTFGGRVAFVDSHDDGAGRFRIVVVPDDGPPWPDARYLRQGVRASGWVLLNQVSVGLSYGANSTDSRRSWTRPLRRLGRGQHEPFAALPVRPGRRRPTGRG